VPLPVSYTVFVSHSSKDDWVARQVGRCVEASGAEAFLDSSAFQTGDDVDRELKSALLQADELLVILSPEALERPYVWMEIGVAWSRDKRIVGVLHGVTTSELAARDGMPAFLIGIKLRDINDIDGYFRELEGRVKSV
jgi:hypothetical protein